MDGAIAASHSWRCRTNRLQKLYSPPSLAAIWNDLHELPAHLPRDWSHHLVVCRQASHAVVCLMLKLCNMIIAADQAYQHGFGCKKRRLAIRQVELIAFSADIAIFSLEFLMHLEGQTFIMVFANLYFLYCADVSIFVPSRISFTWPLAPCDSHNTVFTPFIDLCGRRM